MEMKLLDANYVKSINGTDKIIDDLKVKVAFIGRSNVGKSSLINSLVGRKIAYPSTRPGKTVKLDFFLVENKLYFVDLPGYGFAKRSREDQEHYRRLIAWYLFRSGVNHKFVVLIIDANVGITDYDRESIELLKEHAIPFLVIANKVDKLKQSVRHKTLAQIEAECPGNMVIPYSSYTGEGRAALQQLLVV